MSRKRSRGDTTVRIFTMLLAAALATSATPGVAAPPQAGASLSAARPPRALTKPSSPLIDSRLDQLAEIERRDGPAAARRFAAVNAIPLDEQGRAQILIHQGVERDWARESSATGDDPEQRIGRTSFGEEALFDLYERPVRAAVTRLGGAVHGRLANLVDASLPIANLRSLDVTDGIAWVEPPPARRPTVVSEGVSVIGASTLQASPVSYMPTDPVRVGVLDIGFKGYQSLLGSELPATVTVNSFHPGGIDGDGEDPLDQIHGTACAEIVYDIVPDAELFLVNFNTITDNSDAIDWLIAQDVDVISYSIGWFNAGPGDGRGPVNDAVQRALDAGIEFVVAAGNDARAHWQGQYNDPDGDGFNNFAPNDNDNSVFLAAGQELTVFLNWDDWFASAQDYDLYIVNDDGDVVAAGTSFQTGTQNPTEAAGFTASTSGTYHVMIERYSATRDVNLEMFFFSPREMQYIVPAGSITIPADSEDAVAVGATYWGDDVIEFFSSQGPTTDGRIKPDLTAPDGVSTVSYDNVGFKFFGTSASTPHAAGVIALMKSRFGVYELPQIREILYGRAIDLGIAGKDNIYGNGRLDVVGR
ncbi:MAG: S8 family serine peptidase [Acidobacteriota bacterium]